MSAGIFLGTASHDTSQVAGAAFSRFKRLGIRPFLVGCGAACEVGAVSVAMFLLTRRLFAS